LHGERLKKALCFLIPLAVGALLGDAFLHLIPEAFEGTENAAGTSLLIILGIAAFFFLEKFLRWHHHPAEDATATDDNPQDIGERPQTLKHLGSLVLISDGFHNFIDGIIIAASYLAGAEIGIATTLAVILHEIPQEIGDFGVLLYAGYEKGTALFYNFISAFAAVLGALFILAVNNLPAAFFQSTLPFAAGLFIYIASSDLVPELHRNRENGNLFYEIAGIGLGVLAMYALLFLE
jgi:zinc and cadmium transporter